MKTPVSNKSTLVGGVAIVFTCCLLGGLASVMIVPNPDRSLITIDHTDASLGTVLSDIAWDAGLDLETSFMTPPPRLTIHVQDAQLAPLMTDLCTAYRCTWEVRGTRLIVRMPPTSTPSTPPTPLPLTPTSSLRRDG